MNKNIRLGVNIDHAATLRQLRGGTTAYPDIKQVTSWAVHGGADQITIHLREDRRHIQESDLAMLSDKCPVPLNLEMAGDWKMVRFALKYRPDWVCFVPEKRQELTTEGGLNVKKSLTLLSRMTEKVQRIGIEVSMFIEPSIEQVKASYEAGAEAVEFHTGKWVLLKGPKKQTEWKRLCAAAEAAHDLGLQVHAGHGLDYQTCEQIKKLPYLEEVNVGHSLICYSLHEGLEKAVRKMKGLLHS